MTTELSPLADLLTDHDLLVAALGTPALWTRELAGVLDGAEVTDVHVAPVGTGQVASCLRVTLSKGTTQSSFVVKTGSDDQVNRTVSATLRHGEIEVGFYTHLAPECRVRAPRCYLAAINDAADDYILVLEDLHQHEQADQIGGMTVDHAQAALLQLAELHARWWGEVPEGTESFMAERGDPSAHAVLLGMLHQGFVERYGDRLGPEVMRVADALVEHAAPYLSNRPGPSAVVHGDFRPDNLLVPNPGSQVMESTVAGNPDTVAVVDWQTVAVGAALGDVAYFLGGALLPDARREHERELLDAYRSALASRGVDLSAQQLDEGYRRYSLDGLVMAIGASQVVGRTDRGDDMFCAMAERSAWHALDSGALDMIDG
ncbi:MAG: phosphotransferase [Microthrixaceae bacterium]